MDAFIPLYGSFQDKVLDVYLDVDIHLSILNIFWVFHSRVNIMKLLLLNWSHVSVVNLSGVVIWFIFR